MLKRCLVSAVPLIATLLFHVFPLSEGQGSNQSCVDAAIAKAQLEGATLGEQAAVKTLEFALAACESSTDDYTIFADTGRCGLGIWTSQLLAEDATVGDAKDVVINQCKKVYSHALCTEVGTELFNGHYNDLSANFDAVPGGDFCLSAEELLRAEYYHASGMNKASLLKGGNEKLMRCFPGDSTVMRQDPEGVQEIPLRDLKIGDSIQSADVATGLTFFTKVLFEGHNEHGHAQQNVEFIKLVHASGSLTISDSHFVAIDGGRFVPAMDVMLGDKLVIQTGQSLSNSEVVAIERVVKHGLHAPFTWNGQLLVDGVLASSYVSPAGFSEALKNKLVSLLGWDALYSIIHVIFLPLRIAHASHIPAMLANIAFVPGVPWLVCQFYSCAESASPTESESVPGYVIKIRDFMHFGLSALS